MRAQDDFLPVRLLVDFNLVLQPGKVRIADFKVIEGQSPASEQSAHRWLLTKDIPVISSHIHRVAIVAQSSEIFDDLLPDPIALDEL